MLETTGIIANILQQRELFWIQLINTTYTYGLNDNIFSYGDIIEGLLPFNVRKNPYYQIPLPRKRRNHGIRKRKYKLVDQTLVECATTPNGAISAVYYTSKKLHNAKKKTLVTIWYLGN